MPRLRHEFVAVSVQPSLLGGNGDEAASSSGQKWAAMSQRSSPTKRTAASRTKSPPTRSSALRAAESEDKKMAAAETKSKSELVSEITA